MKLRQMMKRFGRIENIICIAVTFIMVIIIGCIFLMSNRDQLEYSYKYDLSMGWSYEDGKPAELTELKRGEERYVISRHITSEEQHDMSLCFYTKNIYFDIYYNGAMIYSFYQDVPTIFGKAYGVYMHHIEIPSYDDEAELTIEITPIYKDSANFIREMVFMDGGTFVRRELFKDLMSFIMCLVIFLYGGILFVLGLFGENLKERRAEIISIGAFSVVSSLFIVTEVQILQLFTGNPTIVHFMDYMALMFLTYPAIVYVANATGNAKSKLTNIVGVMTLGNCLIQVCLTLLGISDYHQLLHMTHVVILVSVTFIVILIVKGIRQKTFDSKIYRFLVVAFGFTAITGGYDVITYILHSNQRTDGNAFKYGMFFFILIIGTYEMTVILELSRKGQKAELMEELAYHDVLTGLWNRQAYMREEYRIRNEKTGIYTFIMFDVNNLKQMNDSFGHNFGDELIKGAADVIEKSFGEGGMCFRMGGDEFFVIFTGSCGSKSFEIAKEKFESNITEYNERKKLPLPLSIAYGYDEFHSGSDRPEEVERIADNRMYEMKVSMKK